MAGADPFVQASRWTIFCRVIDNLGDAGVCWRLATDLAVRGQHVRLIIDDAAPLRLLAPDGAGGEGGIEVQGWPGEPLGDEDVVIEAFGCDPPDEFIAAMAARAAPPLWIDLEYLSAEDWVERSHGLPSPQVSGLTRWFFFPGFSPGTGGLLRETGLIGTRERFDASGWLRDRGIITDDGRVRVSLFCYANPALAELLAGLADRPTTLLLTQGHAQRQFDELQRRGGVPQTIRPVHLPWLTQAGFDRLLWSCELNIVRGEDSLVRAIWAGVPFIWQAYPQHDGVHHAKVEAMLRALDAPDSMARAWRRWNGSTSAGSGLKDLGDWPSWQPRLLAARDRVLGQVDLATQLLAFAADRLRQPDSPPVART